MEDHPIEYGSFEGVIPHGQYGGGTVMLWDRGTWEPEGDAAETYRRGKLVFRLAGERLKGRWALIRMGGKAGQNGKNWLLKKLDDAEARSADEHDALRDRRQASLPGGPWTRSRATSKCPRSAAARHPNQKNRPGPADQTPVSAKRPLPTTSIHRD